MFYFRNFIFQVKGVGAENILTDHQKGKARRKISDGQDKLNKSRPLNRYKANGNKNLN